jgi:hypothetical protein
MLVKMGSITLYILQVSYWLNKVTRIRNFPSLRQAVLLHYIFLIDSISELIVVAKPESLNDALIHAIGINFFRSVTKTIKKMSRDIIENWS